MNKQEMSERIEKLERERAILVKTMREIHNECDAPVMSIRELGEYVLIGRTMGAARYALTMCGEVAR
jgi:hypothetical protein